MAKTSLELTGKDGSFKRAQALFRHWVKADGRFPPEAGRYHLYISYACPWANRCHTVLNLKGLQEAIGLSVVHPTWQRTRPDKDEHCGWTFRDPADPPLSSSTGHGSFDCSGCIPDTVNGAKFVRDLYEKAAGEGYEGVFSVPVLWDKKESTIVSNESADIVRMLNSEFNGVARHPELDLYPEPLRAEIDAINEWVYPSINNGVYRCGFATSQGAYEAAFRELFSSLDRVEEILSRKRYICGDALTEADIRLFMTLIRFDEVYVVYFKTNKKRICDYPHTREWVRELYNMPAVKETVDMDHIKTHYFTSHPKLNPYAIVPVGGDPWWEDLPKRAL